jgi:hypothetical protein
MENNESGVPDLTFPKETEFLHVEGIPVTTGACGSVPCCLCAWDVSPARPFDPDSACCNGAPISEAQFMHLIVSAKAAS